MEYAEQVKNFRTLQAECDHRREISRVWGVKRFEQDK